MKLEQKIRNKRFAYLFKRKAYIAFEVALLYYILAKRKNAPDKIADACLKAIRWLRRAGVAVPKDIFQLELLRQLEVVEELLVKSMAIIPQPVRNKLAERDPLVHAILAKSRDLGLVYTR